MPIAAKLIPTNPAVLTNYPQEEVLKMAVSGSFLALPVSTAVHREALSLLGPEDFSSRKSHWNQWVTS